VGLGGQLDDGENRFDDFLDELSYALVEGGVSREQPLFT
jgi:hypothetical protein